MIGSYRLISIILIIISLKTSLSDHTWRLARHVPTDLGSLKSGICGDNDERMATVTIIISANDDDDDDAYLDTSNHQSLFQIFHG